MRHRLKKLFTTNYLALTALLLATTPGYAKENIWSQPIRGSWVSDEANGRLLVEDRMAIPVIIGNNPAEPVKIAARLLVRDIEKITGIQPNILSEYTIAGPAIFLQDASRQEIADAEAAAFLEGQVEP